MALESKCWAQANELGTLPLGAQSEREATEGWEGARVALGPPASFVAYLPLSSFLSCDF